MIRAPNEIDFWRGFALVTIFIDHVPGIIFENYTYRHFAISDAAELFVFLAGWSLRLLVSSSSGREESLLRMSLRLEARALTIFCAQIVITEIALAMTAAFAMLLQSPLILEWNNAASVFEDPIETHVGLVMLTHQLGFFDILPLYVVMMGAAPLMVICNRWLPRLLLPASLLLYAVTLTVGFNIPTWPVEGRWYFNPFAWQLVFILGFALAAPVGIGAFARKYRQMWRYLAFPILIAGAATSILDWSPDPLSLPQPRLFLMFDKTFESPARIIHLLALVAFIGGSFRFIVAFARPVTSFLSMLGRNSLNVFCVGSLLSLLAQFTRFGMGGGFSVDILVVVMGLACLSATAWLSEWRERTKP